MNKNFNLLLSMANLCSAVFWEPLQILQNALSFDNEYICNTYVLSRGLGSFFLQLAKGIICIVKYRLLLRNSLLDTIQYTGHTEAYSIR